MLNDRTRLEAFGDDHDLIFAANDVEVKAADDGSPPKVDVLAYTGGKLRLKGFRFPVVIDLTGVKAMGDGDQLPLLRDHDQNRVVGHGTPIIAANELRVSRGVLSITGSERDRVVHASQNGFRWQASVGGSIPNPAKDITVVPARQSVQVNGRTIEGPLHVVRAFLWKETSFVALGADENRASAAIAAALSPNLESSDMNEFEKWLAAKGIDHDILTDDQRTELRAKFDAHEAAIQATLTAPAPAPAAPAAPATVGTDSPETITASLRDVISSEIRGQYQRERRIDGLFAMYADSSLTADERRDLRAQVESGDVSESDAHIRLLQASRGAGNTSNVNSGGRSQGRDNVLALEAAVMNNVGGFDEDSIRGSLIEAGANDDEIDRAMNEMSSPRMKAVGVKAIIAAACKEAGHSFYEIGDDEIECALRHSQTVDGRRQSMERDIYAASGFSTVSLPGILSRMANKAMLAAYAEADNGGVILDIASVTSTTDFKQFDRYRMTEVGVFEKVGASGEIKHGTLTEEPYANQLDTYAKMLSLTRQMMINDDLDAFLQIPRMMGRMGRHALEQYGITVLVDAPTAAGAGTTEFFHGAARGNAQPNYVEGANTNLSLDNLAVPYQYFLDQTDTDGKPIGIEPEILLVTNKNAVVSRKLYNDVEYRFTASDRTETINNQWKGMFRPVKSSYLGRLGTTANEDQWYLLSRPTLDVSAIQVAFLNGQRTPTLNRAETDFNTLGVQWRGYYDFGVALQDPRAAVKSKGKA